MPSSLSFNLFRRRREKYTHNVQLPSCCMSWGPIYAWHGLPHQRAALWRAITFTVVLGSSSRLLQVDPSLFSKASSARPTFMMAFGSLSLSKFRSKKGKVGGNGGDKIESHDASSSLGSQSTTPPPPVVVEASQKPTIASAQPHPIGVDEARDELTQSLRSKYPHNGFASGVSKCLASNFLQGVHFLKCATPAGNL